MLTDTALAAAFGALRFDLLGGLRGEIWSALGGSSTQKPLFFQGNGPQVRGPQNILAARAARAAIKEHRSLFKHTLCLKGGAWRAGMVPLKQEEGKEEKMNAPVIPSASAAPKAASGPCSSWRCACALGEGMGRGLGWAEALNRREEPAEWTPLVNLEILT